MNWTERQKQMFDRRYSKTEPKPTINVDILSELVMNLDLEELAICDVGGGAGGNSAMLKRIIEQDLKSRCGISLVCDISVEGLRRAKFLGLQVIKSSVTHLPFRDDAFDIVLNVHVLEHVVEDSLAIRETGRVVKKGGLLYVGTPNKISNLYVPFILGYHILGRNPLHIRNGYDAEQLTEKYNNLGFKRLLLRYHGFWGASCAHMIDYMIGLEILLLQFILGFRFSPFIRNRINEKIEHIKNKMISWEINVFGNGNPHSINLFIFFEKRK